MNSVSDLIFLILGLLLVWRGLDGLLAFLKGRGTRFYTYYDSEKQTSMAPPIIKWLTWKSSIYWVGSKENASRFERFYLFLLSISQIMAGSLLFFTSFVKFFLQ